MSIVKQVEDYVIAEMEAKLSEDNHYHSIEHTQGVVTACEEIASYYDLTNDDLEDLLIASWFHDLGHIDTFEDHETNSAKMAREFLQNRDYPSERIKKIELIIMSTSMNVPSQGILEEIIHDADIKSIGSESFFEIGNHLRKEWEMVGGLYYNQDEWNQLQLEFLENNDFYTDYARTTYGPVRKKNLEIARTRING